jgi:hypothetical protein
MNLFRIFTLSALSLIGLSAASAQAGGYGRHYSYCRPVCQAPVVVCQPVAPPVVSCAPVVAPPVVCQPVYRTYRAPVYCSPRVVYRGRCR